MVILVLFDVISEWTAQTCEILFLYFENFNFYGFIFEIFNNI